jgi:tetratricopeptide (TPR) repeat protein
VENQLVGANTLKEVFPDLPEPEQFQEIFESLAKEKDQFAVLVLRIDDFDKTLEHLGENITSNLILNVARIIENLSKCRDMDEVSGLELAKNIQERVKLSGQETVSIGLAVYPFWPFEKMNVLDNARKALDHAAFFGPSTITPFDAVSLNISADKLYQYGDIDGAIEEFKKALAVDPKHVNVHNSLGVCYGVQGKLDLAIEAFETAIDLDPGDVMATYNLGLAHHKQGNKEKALELFLHAHKLDGDNPEVACQIGMCYREMHEVDSAIEFLEKAAENTHKGAHIFSTLGECYIDKEMLQEATKAYEKALKLNPTNAKGLSALGYLYGTIGENKV